jgi:three-Cys-motif partner protein
MSTSAFFGESKDQSRVKADIVTKYLATWAKVVIPTTRKKAESITYIDLFAGPSRYEDGTKSTPLKKSHLLELYNTQQKGWISNKRKY